MAAEIEGYGTPPAAGENSRRVPPCMTGLATPMHEQHGPIAIVPPDVGDEMNTLESFEAHDPWIHGLRAPGRTFQLDLWNQRAYCALNCLWRLSAYPDERTPHPLTVSKPVLPGNFLR